MTELTSPSDELTTRIWSAMQTFVAAQDRRRKLQEIIGLGRSMGRVRLLLLLTGGPLTLREIAEANGVDAPYATIIVDKLVTRGLLERTAHPDDNRRKLVQLTTAGREAAQLAGLILAEPPEPIALLPQNDLVYLDNILARLVQRLSLDRAP
jgi:DNA-binding MarR family transcriptional regulator